jgi:hypothetical protein
MRPALAQVGIELAHRDEQLARRALAGGVAAPTGDRSEADKAEAEGIP